MNITLFEIHLDDSTFSSTIGTGEERAEPEAEETQVGVADEMVASDAEDGGRSLALLVPVFVVLGVAVGIAVARKLRGGDDVSEELGEPVEIDA
jgi:hypothetical protein